jgi:hypothetical protein
MKGVSKHGNEHSTFSAHFSTMGRIKLRQIKLSLHFVHSRPKEKLSCFQLPNPLPFLVSKIFFIHHLIRNSPGPPLSSTNNTDHHDTTEILLKVALNTIKQIVFFRLFYTDTLQE